MAKRRRAHTDMFKPDYPTNAHPPKCPTCGMRLPSDHAMVGVDEAAMEHRTRKGKGNRAKGRGPHGRAYSGIEDRVSREM